MRIMRNVRVRLADATYVVSGFSRTAFVSVLLLSCLIDIEARQQGVQQFDAPQPGARSPRSANYEIDVTLDHAARRLTGRETIRWRNISANAAWELQFHLYWNAWRDLESTWLRERRLAGAFTPPRTDAWGSMDVTRVRVRGVDLTSQKRFIAPDEGNAADQTVMAVPLPLAVAPDETIEIEVEWTAKVPRPFARTGYVGNYYFIAQWFPKLGVLEDRGWNTHQFHSATEFYADYGVYDVRITVPQAFVVGASGRQMERTDVPGGQTRHRFRGEDIHDFAWTASPDFVEARQTFTHPAGPKGPALPSVEMRLLLQPEHAGQEQRHFEATAAALRYGGEWFGPYPYDHITIVDPAFQSGSGGMEYPTLITAGSRWIAPAAVSQPQRVTIHEALHQFWYGIVGTNEFEHAWMDEGFTTFSEARVMEAAAIPNYLAPRFFGGFIPWPIRDIHLSRATDGNRLPGYRGNAEADAPSTPTFRYWPATATFISYNKTALSLHTLERHLGWPVLQRILSTYFDRWKFRHPQPADFFATVDEVSGRDLGWFFDETYGGSNVFDYAVQSFTSTRVRLKPDATYENGYRTVVVVQRLGEAIFPVEIVTTFRGGERVTERWDGRDRRVAYTYERQAEALSVEVDPGRVLLLDVNYTNNSATLAPRAREASLKWSLKWLAWLQELLLTYSFFA
jgi:aminopeptidase N